MRIKRQHIICRVYWGSHGCKKRRGHRGKHKCIKGCPNIKHYVPFGEDWKS